MSDEWEARFLAVSAFKRTHGRSPDPDELDRLLPPVNCRRTRDRLGKEKSHGS